MEKGTRAGGSRARVLARLRRAPRTVNELAAELRLTDNAIRSHLSGLEAAGQVERAGVRQGGGPGKPALVYRLSAAGEATSPKAYGPALEALLDVLKQRRR